MSTDERRALAIILALFLLASGARWLDRPRPLLDHVPNLDLVALEEQSRAAQTSPKRAHTAAAQQPGAPEDAATTGPIDLNRAGPKELERLPGVGPKLAARLIARRDSSGPFRSWDDVDAVPGIGPVMLARLKELARIDP